MNTMDSPVLSDRQYERFLNLCARAIGTINKFISLRQIWDMGDGKYKINVAYKGYYSYQMVYDGKRIIECIRLLC